MSDENFAKVLDHHSKKQNGLFQNFFDILLKIQNGDIKMDTPVTHFNAETTKENKLEKARKNIALIKQIDKLEKEISTLEKKIQVKKSKIDELVAQL